MRRDAVDRGQEGTLVPWRRVAQRLLGALVAAVGVLVVGTVVGWGSGRGATWDGIAPWVGVAVLVLVVGVVLVVGGSALRAMLRAGDRGERLAGGDVGLLPPQVRSGPRDVDP